MQMRQKSDKIIQKKLSESTKTKENRKKKYQEFPHGMVGKESDFRSSCQGTAKMNLTRNHVVADLILGLAQWVKYPALQ